MPTDKDDTPKNESVARKNKRALRHLLGLGSPPEVEQAEFDIEVSVSYPLVAGEETEADAREFLRELMEHDGEQIQMTIGRMERVDNA